MLRDFYTNKKVFVTGHTGFKGSWLSLWLKNSGAKVYGYSLEPNTNPSMFKELKIGEKIDKSFIGNILDTDFLEKVMSEIKPDIVFHLAAMPIVRLSYKEPKLTYETNVIGTLNVLEAARKCGSVKAFVNITTDKCYENKEIKEGYREDSPLGGYDMYSSSKACTEILSSSYRHSFLSEENAMSLATVRAGNVIGGGDWAQDRLVPDCIRYINRNERIEIRNPDSIRPWQFVLEPLSGYLLLGEKLFEQGKEYDQGFNFGPLNESILSVQEITEKVCQYYQKGEIEIKKKDNLHEAGLLMLNIEKAEKVLGWIPSYDTERALKETVDWYKAFYEGNTDMYEYTIKQIKEYERSIKWAKKS